MTRWAARVGILNGDSKESPMKSLVTAWIRLRNLFRKHTTDGVPDQRTWPFLESLFRDIRLGFRILAAGNRIDGKQTINGARGFNRKIADRFDLTLECIRRHYLGQRSPLGETLARYRDFFALFEDFRGYVEFFMLQDLVTDDCSEVRFFMSFDDFNAPSVPRDGDTYKEYRRLSIEFIKARNCRIDRYAAICGEIERTCHAKIAKTGRLTAT